VATDKGSFKVTLKPKLIVGVPGGGWCVYELSTFELKFSPAVSSSLYFYVEAGGTATAKLDKTLTLGENCSATQAWEVVFEGITSEALDEYHTEPVS